MMHLRLRKLELETQDALGLKPDTPESGQACTALITGLKVSTAKSSCLHRSMGVQMG